MWSAGSEQHLYLDSSELQALDAVMRDWKGALPPEAKRSVAHIWLSGALAVPFMLPPIEGLRNRAEAQRLAESSAPVEAGLQGSCTVWLDAWKPGRPCLAVAVQQELVAAIQAAASGAGIKLKSMQPWWNWALSDHLHRKGAVRLLAVIEEDALTVIGSDGERVTSAQSQRPRPAPERIDAQLRRQAVSLDVSIAEVLRVSMSRDAKEGEPAPGGVARWQEQGL